MPEIVALTVEHLEMVAIAVAIATAIAVPGGICEARLLYTPDAADDHYGVELSEPRDEFRNADSPEARAFLAGLEEERD